MNKKADRIRTRLPAWTVLLLLLCLAALLSYAALKIKHQQHRQTFTPAGWKQAKNINGITKKYGMVEDLMTHHLKKGMSRQQVLDLLGEPDYGPDQYYLGPNPSRSFDMDPDCLALTFDKGGNLISFQIYDGG
jgi:hypothetical protein